jgi:glyoxylase-like metal-dependent hydrolase (beta-lactamase superfamily II)
MELHSLTLGPFQENTYILVNDDKECILIDPGCYDSNDRERLKSFIESKDLKPVRLINTHCHIDHIFGWNFVYKTWGLKPEYTEKDQVLVDTATQHATMYGLNMDVLPEAGGYLPEEGILKWGDIELEILFCPGHAPGHICFYHKETKTLVAGDVIFRLSIGRTDLPYCNHEDLLESIRTKIYTLPGDVEIYPGHGPKTRVDFEMQNNPFVMAK